MHTQLIQFKRVQLHGRTATMHAGFQDNSKEKGVVVVRLFFYLLHRRRIINNSNSRHLDCRRRLGDILVTSFFFLSDFDQESSTFPW